jgi:hypothetical protein
LSLLLPHGNCFSAPLIQLGSHHAWGFWTVVKLKKKRSSNDVTAANRMLPLSACDFVVKKYNFGADIFNLKFPRDIKKWRS